MTRILDISVAVAFFALGATFFAVTFGDEFDVPTFGGDVGPAFAPRLFLAAWMIFSGIILVQALRSKPDPLPDVRIAQMSFVVVIAVLTGFAVTKIGFVFATIPGVALFCWAFQYRNPVKIAVFSVAPPLVIWALFTFGFELLLPRSPWFHSI